jgi:hypothetical protein
MSKIVVTAIELVVSAYSPWSAFAIAAANTAYQSVQARRRRRDQVAAYNASLVDRLEMADITPEAARTIVMGRVRYVEGIRRRWESGTNSEKLTMIVSFSGHEIDGFEQWFLNDLPVTLDGSGWVQATSVGTGAGYTTTATGFAVGTTSIPLITGSGTIAAGDLVQFSGDSSYYKVTTGISAPGTIVLAAPGLQKAIPASATALTLVRAPYASTVRSPYSDAGTLDGSGNATLTLSHTPSTSSTPTVTWTTGSGDTTNQGSASVSVTGTTATITGGAAGAAFTCNYLADVTTSYVRIRPYLGTSTQSVGTDHAAEYPGKLKTTDHFKGIACALVDCIYNPDVFPSGRPTITAVFRGAKVYDPRLDSTVSGGSGTQRVTDSTTWTFSENPALHAYHYARHANGWAVPNADIRVSDAMAAATVCDISTVYTLTATGGGTTTVTLPQFRCGITIVTGGDQRGAMDSIVETMAGRWAWSGGAMRMRAGVMAASAFTLDQTWIAQLMGSGASGPVVKGANGITRDQRYNRVTGTCIDPDQRYQALPFPAVEDATLIAAKGERQTSVSYAGVNHIAHAQHLATVEIREAQAGLRLEMTCNLYALLVELFDVGTINLSRFGMTGKTAEVVGWKWHPQMGITLQMAEITAALFDTSATLNGRDPAPDSTLRLPTSVEAISGVSVSSGTTATLDGAILTRTVVSWTAAVTDYVRQGGRIEVQYTLAAAALPTGDWPSVTEAGSATQTTITGLLAGRFYLFRVRALQPTPSLVRGGWCDPVIAQIAAVPTTAATALANANAALADLANIASDNILSAGEKPRVITDYSVLTSEQSGIDAQATAYGITTEKTAYDSAISALTTYLGTLTSPTAWNSTAGDTTIVGTTFRSTFEAVYSARQTLLNAIAALSRNAAITIGSNGTLSGAGGGQVTLPGMGQHSYRVVSTGSSCTAIAPSTSGLYRDGTIQEGYTRSYNVAVISRATGLITGFQQFDVYGVGTGGVGGTAATMAAYLNSLDTTVIVVVYSFDEPQNNRLTSGLDTAMYRCGASRAVFGSPQFHFRSAYTLIGIPGCGESNGAEFYQGSIDSDPDAWCDASFTVLNGGITGVSTTYKPRTLLDYGYSGSLTATDGATFGVNISGTAASTDIAVGAVTVPVNGTLSSDITLPTSSTEGVIFTIGSLDSLGQPVHVTGNLTIKTVSSSTPNGSWILHVKVGSTVVAAYDIPVLVPSSTYYYTVPIDALVTPPSGSQSVTITCSCASSTGASAYLMATQTPGTSITAVGLKR